MAGVRLDTRIMVQSLVTIADAGGGQSRSWSDFREVWAQVQWDRPGKDAESGKAGYRRTVVVTLRWAPDLPDPMRLIAAQRSLDVIAGTRLLADPDFFQAECEERF